MPLSRYERKEKLPHGAQKEIAKAEGVAESAVSRVMNDKAYDDDPKKVRRIRVRIARKIGLPVAEVFPDIQASLSTYDGGVGDHAPTIDPIRRAQHTGTHTNT